MQGSRRRDPSMTAGAFHSGRGCPASVLSTQSWGSIMEAAIQPSFQLGGVRKLVGERPIHQEELIIVARIPLGRRWKNIEWSTGQK